MSTNNYIQVKTIERKQIINFNFENTYGAFKIGKMTILDIILGLLLFFLFGVVQFLTFVNMSKQNFNPPSIFTFSFDFSLDAIFPFSVSSFSPILDLSQLFKMA